MEADDPEEWYKDIEVDLWKHCYDSHRWDSLRDETSISHPAKMANGLLEKVFKFLMSEGILKFGDTVLDTAKGISDRAVRETAGRAYENAKDAWNRRGETAGEAGKQNGGGRSGIAPSEVRSRCDFVPGERVIFFDDFHDTGPGEFPRRWTVTGPDSNSWKAPVEVAQYGGKRWVRYRPSNERTDILSSFYARLDAGKDMPDDFTVEFDAVLPPFDGTDQRPEYRLLLVNYGREYQGRDYDVGSNVVRIGSIGASSANTQLPFERGDGQPHRVAIRVSGTSVKACLDGEMIVNDPEGIVRPVTVIGMELAYQTGSKILPLMFTDFRVAGSGLLTERRR